MKKSLFLLLTIISIMICFTEILQAQQVKKQSPKQFNEKQSKFNKAVSIANNFNSKYLEALQKYNSFKQWEKEYDKILKIENEDERLKSIVEFHKKNQKAFKSIQDASNLNLNETLKSISSLLANTGIIAKYANGNFDFQGDITAVYSDPVTNCDPECEILSLREFVAGTNSPPPPGLLIPIADDGPIESIFKSIGNARISDAFPRRGLSAEILVERRAGAETSPFRFKEIIVPLETKCVTLKLKYKLNSGVITSTFSTAGFAYGKTSASVTLTDRVGNVLNTFTPTFIAIASGPLSAPAESLYPEQEIETTIDLDPGGVYNLIFSTMADAGVGIQSLVGVLPCDYSCNAGSTFSNITVELCMKKF